MADRYGNVNCVNCVGCRNCVNCVFKSTARISIPQATKQAGSILVVVFSPVTD
jgi:hypothetical protein